MFKPSFSGKWLSIATLASALFFTVACSQKSEKADAVANAPTDSAPVSVLFKTSMGDFSIEINTEKAPATAKNFLQYVNDGFYNNTIFHRVIDNFMVQGGGFDQAFNKKTTREPIQNEADNGLQNITGSVAMARTNNPHSATAQFFINVTDNGFLNHSSKTPAGWGYAVFGQVNKGMETINAIKAVSTGVQNGHQNVPLTPVVIESATVVKP